MPYNNNTTFLCIQADCLHCWPILKILMYIILYNGAQRKQYNNYAYSVRSGHVFVL